MITPRGSDRPIGSIGARFREYKVDIGYVLARSHWKKGYMTEAVSVLTDWILAQPVVFRLWAVCDVENRGSARVLEKAGFEHEGASAADSASEPIVGAA